MIVAPMHSCYEADVLLREGDTETTRIRWYRAAPGAKALPVYTCWGPSVWETNDGVPPPDPGELREGHDWRPNQLGWGPPPGQHFHGPPEWFMGLPPDWRTIPIPDPDPACIMPALLVQYTDESAPRIFDCVEIDIDKSRGLALVSDLGPGRARIVTTIAQRTQLGVIASVDQVISGLTRWYGDVAVQGVLSMTDPDTEDSTVRLIRSEGTSTDPALTIQADVLPLVSGSFRWALHAGLEIDGSDERALLSVTARDADAVVLSLNGGPSAVEESFIRIDGQDGVTGTQPDGTEVYGGVVVALGSGGTGPPSPGSSLYIGYEGP